MTKSLVRYEQLSFRIEPEARAAIAAAAERDRRPVSSLVRCIIADWLKAHASDRGQVAA
jgi:hypothetical protein